MTNWSADKGLHPQTEGHVNMTRDDGVEMLFQGGSLLLETSCSGQGSGWAGALGNTVMTAATCKTQAEQTTGINHPADTTASTTTLHSMTALSAFSKHKENAELLQEPCLGLVIPFHL